MEDLEPELIECGLSDIKYFGFVTKAKWQGISVDLFNPETDEDKLEYGKSDTEIQPVPWLQQPPNQVRK